jgi:DNA polymerase-3 subunit epsilon
MVDAEMASHLWCRIHADVARRWGIAQMSHALLARAQATPRDRLDHFFSLQPSAAKPPTLAVPAKLTSSPS